MVSEPWDLPNTTDYREGVVVEDTGEAPGIVAWSAAELSAAIHSRQVSCVEVMTAYLDHIERSNLAVNALVMLREREALLEEARAKDQELAGGAEVGWMHGFPHAVKDLADVRGLPTTFGFFTPEEIPAATQDSLFVERIRAAGAIVIGKTNTPEFGLGSHTYNTVFGTTVNAYDPTRSAGGSSGGAAVAVALRMLPVADGSDFMGSLRNPPGWNNVLGLRPSAGRVPDTGEHFISQGGAIGPIARTAEDLALLLRTLSGYDVRSPLSLPDDPTLGLPLGDVRGRRVGWLGDLGGYLPMEPEVLEVCGAAVGRLGDLGLRVTELDDLPSSDGFAGNEDLWPMWRTFRHWLVGGNLAAVHAIPQLRDRLKPEAAYEVEGLLHGLDGRGPLTALDVYRCSAKRSAMYDAFLGLFERFDYLVVPSAQVLPFDADLPWPASIDGRAMSSYHRWMEVTTIGTLLGAPTLAMPAGFSRAGLPVGLQVIGPHHADRSVLELAAAWEAETRWVDDRPPPSLQDGSHPGAAS